MSGGDNPFRWGKGTDNVLYRQFGIWLAAPIQPPVAFGQAAAHRTSPYLWATKATGGEAMILQLGP